MANARKIIDRMLSTPKHQALMRERVAPSTVDFIARALDLESSVREMNVRLGIQDLLKFSVHSADQSFQVREIPPHVEVIFPDGSIQKAPDWSKAFYLIRNQLMVAGLTEMPITIRREKEQPSSPKKLR